MAKKPGGGCKKAGRSKKKAAGRTSHLSAFVRGRITGEQYFNLTGQTLKRV
jgi:hypothetical protein